MGCARGGNHEKDEIDESRAGEWWGPRNEGAFSIKRQTEGELEEFALPWVVTFDESASLKEFFLCFGMKAKAEHGG